MKKQCRKLWYCIADILLFQSPKNYKHGDKFLKVFTMSGNFLPTIFFKIHTLKRTANAHTHMYSYAHTVYRPTFTNTHIPTYTYKIYIYIYSQHIYIHTHGLAYPKLFSSFFKTFIKLIIGFP